MALNPSAMELGLLLADDVAGQWTSLTIPNDRVISGCWLQEAVETIQSITQREVHVDLVEQGIRLMLGHCVFTARKRLMHAPLPAPVALLPGQPLVAPKVLYCNRVNRTGVLCTSQPVSGETLHALRASAPNGLQSRIDFQFRTGFVWHLSDDAGLPGYADLMQLQQPYLRGTCSVRAVTHNLINSTLKFTLEGPVGYPFSLEDAQTTCSASNLRQLNDHCIELQTFCHIDRSYVWLMAERLAWSQHLFPVAPLSWHDQPGSRIVIDVPRRCTDWPLM